MDEVIKAINLTYKYPDGTVALKGINLEINRGERVALLGPNGAGKSTFLMHLNGTLRGEGELRINGLEPSKANLNKIRSSIGLVFQDPDDQLFLTTVFDDVSFGPINQGLSESEVIERVKGALEVVDMLWATNKPAHHLSFGQKKRVALATVLSMNPKVLILDEPTSNLDPRARRRLESLLTNLEHTMIVATHNLDFAWRVCDRSIILSSGKIVADGPTRETLGDEALLEANGLEIPMSAMLDSFKNQHSDIVR
ncbi:MAG: ATP-binding cassette domain-containing protein [Actinobacteria bacterium]|nr:ATP-binding cassette domain-containing protein [Actinomycetota bacterium]